LHEREPAFDPVSASTGEPHSTKAIAGRRTPLTTLPPLPPLQRTSRAALVMDTSGSRGGRNRSLA